jgi:hypothetical protein
MNGMHKRIAQYAALFTTLAVVLLLYAVNVGGLSGQVLPERANKTLSSCVAYDSSEHCQSQMKHQHLATLIRG